MLRRASELLRDSPITTGGGLFLAMLGYFWLSGTLMPTVWSSFWTSPLQLTGLALANAAIPAYLVASFGHATRKSNEVVEALMANGVVSREAGANRLAELGHVPHPRALLALAVGLVLASFNVPWSYLRESFAGPTPAMDVSVALGSLVVWCVVAQVGYRRIRSARIFSEMGREDARVDLLRIAQLKPIGRTGTLNVLIIIGALSLLPLQSLDAELRWYNYLNGFLVGIPAGIALLLLPMLGIHRRIRAEKATELDRLDRAISEAGRELAADPLGHLNDLLAMRERVLGVREWPMDTTTYRRIGLYGIIPPLAWAGAALVEIVLSSALS